MIKTDKWKITYYYQNNQNTSIIIWFDTPKMYLISIGWRYVLFCRGDEWLIRNLTLQILKHNCCFRTIENICDMLIVLIWKWDNYYKSPFWTAKKKFYFLSKWDQVRLVLIKQSNVFWDQALVCKWAKSSILGLSDISLLCETI